MKARRPNDIEAQRKQQDLVPPYPGFGTRLVDYRKEPSVVTIIFLAGVVGGLFSLMSPLAAVIAGGVTVGACMVARRKIN